MPPTVELSAKLPQHIVAALNRLKSVKGRTILADDIDYILQLTDPQERRRRELLLMGALHYLFKMGQVCLEDYQTLTAFETWPKAWA